MEMNGKIMETFNKGEIIFRQNEFGSCMYDIEKGTVGIYVNYGEDGEKLLAVLDSDDYFGEMGMIESYPRSATAVALEDGTEAEIITRENFGAYFEEKPEKVLLIMRHMGDRVRALTDGYMEACRAVAEASESVRTGEEKSGWLKEFLHAYKENLKHPAVFSTTKNLHW
ncbi:MAG: cyclic nucleotide-binding domain-containing protein [Oscillospiraceae bacterium]|nr:cyclic nucleotide-binding domain-containing protein [Oscillospiraceae bacterium]